MKAIFAITILVMSSVAGRAASVRGTFGGTVYQVGNLIASVNVVLQAGIAERSGGNYSWALMAAAVGAALLIAVTMALGPEAHNVDMAPPPRS